LEDKKRKIEAIRTINEAAEADIQKFSGRYYTGLILRDSGQEGGWEGWPTREATTDNAIRNYLGKNLRLEVCDINEIPHKDAKFASIYATAASSILTGLFVYYATRDDETLKALPPFVSYAIRDAGPVKAFPVYVFTGEFVFCDMILDGWFPTSKLAYYLSSGIRVAVPAIAGLFALNSLIKGRKTGQNTNIKVAPSKKKEKEGEEKERKEEKEEFPDVWTEIPKDEEKDEVPNVWKRVIK
jgi:hypothetical protein